jgi:hypothetical protein
VPPPPPPTPPMQVTLQLLKGQSQEIILAKGTEAGYF